MWNVTNGVRIRAVSNALAGELEASEETVSSPWGKGENYLGWEFLGWRAARDVAPANPAPPMGGAPSVASSGSSVHVRAAPDVPPRPEHAEALTLESVLRMKTGLPVITPPSVSSASLAGAVSVAPEILVDASLDPGGFDVYSVNLTAGECYLFSAYGSGAAALADPILYLFDGDVNFITLDDDGGVGSDSLLTYTASATGEYFVGVGSFGSGGDYTFDALPLPNVDFGGDLFDETTPLLQLDTVYYGAIDSANFLGQGPGYWYGELFGEVDSYSIVFEAGKIYRIDVAGGADYASDPFNLPPGELDPYIALFDPDINFLGYGFDVDYPIDLTGRITVLAPTSGTYYFDVFAPIELSGGFSIEVTELDFESFDVKDAINWFDAENVPYDENNTAYVYFALPGESFGQLADNGIDPLPSFGWNDFEKQQMMLALGEYEKILGVNYEITTDSSEAVFRFITTTSEFYGAYMTPRDTIYGEENFGIGAFNVDSFAWRYDEQQTLLKGGEGFYLLLHELGHGHGLAHPHDGAGGSDVMLGVTASFFSYGLYDLNQGVYTTMSYNTGWYTHPDGFRDRTDENADNGWSTLGAFDIAVLQERYGVINPYATGNNVYLLKDVQDVGTYYECIWDTGGRDTIQYNGARSARIDLLAATIDYSPTGGGVLCYVDEIWGGYTIAQGVVIENATGGSGADILLGNSAANVITGNGGDDILMGRGGADTLNGGAGFDTASYIDSTSGVVASLSGPNTGGDAAGDVLNSIEALVGSNFADNLSAGNGSDTIDGMGGNDTISGGNKDDTLSGGDDNDVIYGDNQNDVLWGEDGDDKLFGGNHDDFLHGGAGNDTLDGGKQNDTLNGGAGNDVLTGGKQDDVFIFSDLGGFDTITDFERGGDKVDLRQLDAINGGAHNAFTWIGSAGFHNVAGELRAYAVGASKYFAGDTDGDGVADFLVQTNVLLTKTDFLFS